MACDRIQTLLPEMADAALGAKDTMDVVQHLRGCQQCSISWKRHLEIQHYFLQNEPKQPEAYWQHQRRQLIDQIAWSSASIKAAETRPVRWGWIAAGAAAAAVFLIALLVVLSSPASKPVDESPEIVETTPPAPPAPKPKEPDAVVKQTPPAPPPKLPPKPAPEPKKPEPPKPEPKQPDPPAPEPKQPDAQPPEPPKPEPQPPVKPDPDPVKPEPPKPPAPEPVPAMAMPGDPAHRAKLLEEQLAILNSRTDAELIGAVLYAGRQRLDEAKAASDGKRDEAEAELLASYIALVGEGASEIVLRARDPQTRKLAEQQFSEQVKHLESLKASMGKAVDPALAACKAAAAGRKSRPSLRKSKHGVLTAMQETAEVAAAKTFDLRVVATLEMLDRRVDAMRADVSRSDDEAAAYDAFLNRSLVPSLKAQRDGGKDVAGLKARTLRSLDAHIKALKDLAKKNAGNAGLQRALLAAQTGRDAAAAITDPAAPQPPPPPPPPPPKDPPPSPKGGSESVDD